jgi:hypothetical protein
MIADKNRFISGTGIHCRREELSKPKDTKDIEEISFISPFAIEAFHIDFNKKDVLEKNKIDIIKDLRLYHAPMLLVRKGLDTLKLTTKAAISFEDVTFKDAITSIKHLEADVGILRNMLGIINSQIYTYLSINTFASIGIEREQTQNYNKFSVPYIDCSIVELVESIEQAKIDLYKEKNNILSNKSIEIQRKIDKAMDEINNVINKALKLNIIEKALLDYALTIDRPLIPLSGQRKYNALNEIIKPLQVRSKELNDYAKIFINRFKLNLDDNKQKFIVRILHTDQIIGMFFEVVSTKISDEDGIIWDIEVKDKILPIIIRLGSEKITDKLFVQKDIRGFEKDRFYIFKPNERRLWHKAIAYLDVEEFMDASLKAGRDGK